MPIAHYDTYLALQGGFAVLLEAERACSPGLTARERAGGQAADLGAGRRVRGRRGLRPPGGLQRPATHRPHDGEVGLPTARLRGVPGGRTASPLVLPHGTLLPAQPSAPRGPSYLA